MTYVPDRASCNRARLQSAGPGGHYESWFQRANHDTRPLAFWIRYTALLPQGSPERGCGELWAIWFDGERGRTVAVKERHPLSSCAFSARELDVRISSATLHEGRLQGGARSCGSAIDWQLEYDCEQAPLLLLPERMYEGGFPRAKSLVGAPAARYHGSLEVDGESIAIDGWRGSQNHNWGSRHTDRYAWGQVAGFDDAPDAFLECASARLRMGPLWTPWITPLVLRLDGREHRLNALGTALRARARASGLEWSFETAGPELRVAGHMRAPREAFVALTYDDPSGRQKICLNSKLARCELRVEVRGRTPRMLHSAARAAFELLSDSESCGVPIVL